MRVRRWIRKEKVKYPMRRHSIAVLPGDGIGKEVTPAAMLVLEQAARRHGFVLEQKTYPWNCDFYKETGRMMPADGLEQLARHDAIFLGRARQSPAGS